jgi:hypothetical protein
MTVINSDNISSGNTSTTDLIGSPACIGYSQVLDISSSFTTPYNTGTNYYFSLYLAPHSSPHNLNNWDTSFNVTAGVYLCTWSIYLYNQSGFSSNMWFNCGIVDTSYNQSFGLTYNGTTYTNLYVTGTNYASNTSNTIYALGNAIINNGSLVINTVGVSNKSFSFLCQVLYTYNNSISIISGNSFFQYTRIA